MRRLAGLALAFPLVVTLVPVAVALRWIDRRFMAAVVTGEDIETEHDVALFRAQLADKEATAAWLGAQS